MNDATKPIGNNASVLNEEHDANRSSLTEVDRWQTCTLTNSMSVFNNNPPP
jgi:hypothetical protein